MAFWKQIHNRTEGFSLIEVMVSIAILGFVAVPMFSGLLFSYRLNHRSDEKLQAQLAVSNAVETIMAEGFNEDWHEETSADPAEEIFYYETRFPDVDVNIEDDSEPAIKFTVASEAFSDIAVTTYARPYTPVPDGGDP